MQHLPRGKRATGRRQAPGGDSRVKRFAAGTSIVVSVYSGTLNLIQNHLETARSPPAPAVYSSAPHPKSRWRAEQPFRPGAACLLTISLDHLSPAFLFFST